ncbi:centrosomal protein of 170 kDa protein B isoform X3 [Takifugu flavidus]|uniref:centrosomal protein of 170 kDa protein B isoform X3 n=1 Tax=Takifugu flavidus TaxID=433684 RepID=UPI00254421CA|nr:centrosomal protein of 170 kDa protein B isoform X3 [Takifugu flavidus]
MSVTSWFLVSSSGTRHRLPREMIFVGRDDCELMLQSRSVDKQHAVINYDHNADEHMVKDLGSLNGTFVNDLRIPEQTYITLKLSDVIRFGYDAHVYILEKSQHKVPEEALKHEKYTSQLQLSLKALEARAKEKLQFHSSEKTRGPVSNVKLQERTERKAHSLTAATDSPISKPTPLYGQPSWWGEDEDPAKIKQERKFPEAIKDVRYEVNGSLSDSQAKSLLSYHREPSYFEIPTKETLPRLVKKPEPQVDEVPTKDTPNLPECVPSAPTPAMVQSHASFTIEFDDCTPGKMKIKDHITKFSFRQPRKLPLIDSVTTPSEVISAENKVADWLVHSNASMMRRKSPAEDMYSTNSDPSFRKMDNANNYEDGTYSDLGKPAVNGNEFSLSEPEISSYVSSQFARASPPQRFTSSDSEQPLSSTPPESQSRPTHCNTEPHKAFVIEFFDDNSRKKHTNSPTNSASSPEYPGVRVLLEKSRKSTSPPEERKTSNTPPTQRYTIPLKDPAPIDHQRAGSLRREKTEDRISTGFSSRSSSSVPTKPFSSVGRRSKFAQEFIAEFQKQAKQLSSASNERNASSLPTAAKMETVVASHAGRSPSRAPSQPQTSSPIHQPVPLTVPVMPLSAQNVEAKSVHVCPKNEEDDNLSDTGTYTIETDVQDGELEEARSKVDKVFGVCESPEQNHQSEAETSAAFSPVNVESREQHRQSSSGEVRPAAEQGQSLVKVQSADVGLKGAPKWKSCWASLADSYTESGAPSGFVDIPSQMELSGGAQGTCTNKAGQNDSADREGSRSPHVPPHLPPGEKTDIAAPSIHVHYDPHTTFDVEDKSLAGCKSPDSIHRLLVQNDVEPDSLSDASKSEDGSLVDERRRPLSDTEEMKHESKPRLPAQSTSFYIGSEEAISKTDHGGSKSRMAKTEKKHTTKSFSTATLTKPRRSHDTVKVRPNVSAPVLCHGSESREGTSSTLLRQKSFTKEKSGNVKLPSITSQSTQIDSGSESVQGTCKDTRSYLKETEDVLAVLEAKLQAAQSEMTPVADSLSGESDIDTSSTVSQHSNRPRSNTLTKKAPITGFRREKSSASITSQDSVQLPGASERRHSQRVESKNQSESVWRHVELKRSVGKYGSTDLSDDPQSLPCSDQETNTHPPYRKYTVPLQKEDGKTSRVSQVLSRTKSLSAPRPTRASMLRRARLGEASDNEGPETEKPVQEVGSAPSKQPQESKKLSRLDMLAMPRKRTNSFNTPSDTEIGRSTGFSNRSAESAGNSARRASAPGPKPVERPQKPPLNRTPLTRVRSSSAKYASSTATLHSPRPQPRPRAQPVVALHPKQASKESEDNKHEGETLHNWSNHSAEIARLSQDLAKDLAILAREIHDVAGDGEPTNIDPAATAEATQEKLVSDIPEAGLNHQRVSAGTTSTCEPVQSSMDHKERSRQQDQSTDEAKVDNLMLNPVSQVIVEIRENTEQLAAKIKTLFQDRMDIWEEIEVKVNSENDVPVVKTSNKEITSILKELMRVQRQLEVINTVMDPRGQPDLSRTSASAASSSRVRLSRSTPSRDFRTVHSTSKRGGGPRPGDSVRRAAVTPDDVRQGYLV